MENKEFLIQQKVLDEMHDDDEVVCPFCYEVRHKDDMDFDGFTGEPICLWCKE